jgi:hypothetical protein
MIEILILLIRALIGQKSINSTNRAVRLHRLIKKENVGAIKKKAKKSLAVKQGHEGYRLEKFYTPDEIKNRQAEITQSKISRYRL